MDPLSTSEYADSIQALLARPHRLHTHKDQGVFFTFSLNLDAADPHVPHTVAEALTKGEQRYSTHYSKDKTRLTLRLYCRKLGEPAVSSTSVANFFSEYAPQSAKQISAMKQEADAAVAAFDHVHAKSKDMAQHVAQHPRHVKELVDMPAEEVVAQLPHTAAFLETFQPKLCVLAKNIRPGSLRIVIDAEHAEYPKLDKMLHAMFNELQANDYSFVTYESIAGNRVCAFSTPFARSYPDGVSKDIVFEKLVAGLKLDPSLIEQPHYHRGRGSSAASR